jgi:subtilase family serine protease
MANTNVQIYWPDGWKPSEVAPPKADLEPYAGYYYETPGSLACIYGLTSAVTGCNPSTLSVTSNVQGGTQSIAIVDAYDDPWAGPDLAYFSAQFGLPFTPSQLQVVYQDGSYAPPIDYSGGWELEESLDIEYAHAMSPGATIYLVEADSSSFYDLATAVTMAGNLVRCKLTTTCPTTATGKGEVTMSWGGQEFTTTVSGPGETTLDSTFVAPNVVFFASSGDGPGTIYPCVSPNVVCVGGTTNRRSPATGAEIGQVTWDSAGGGISLYEPVPSYQSSTTIGISSIVGKFRGVPDVSAVANPITGVWVWDSNYPETEGGGWFIVGGTSVASPVVAGIVNKAGAFSASSNAELTKIYTDKAVTTAYTDITSGNCGYYSGWSATAGWDFCTGVGIPKGYTDK